MAEDVEEDFEEEPDEEGGSKGKGSRKKLLILILIPVLLVVIGAAVAFFTGMADGLMGGGDDPEAHGEAEAGDHAAPADDGHGGGDGHGGEEGGAHSGYIELSEMLVDLHTSGRKRTFLKLRVSLELANPADAPKVESELPRIVDSFQVYLRELRVEDLQGSAGMYRLKEELLRRVNMAVKPVRVTDVLFGEMLIQ